MAEIMETASARFEQEPYSSFESDPLNAASATGTVQ